MGKEYNINRKPLSDEQINQNKDFDSVLKEAQKSKYDDPPKKKKWIRKFMTGLAVIGAAITLYFVNNKESENTNPKEVSKLTSNEIKNPQLSWDFSEREIFYLTPQADTFKTKYGSELIIPEQLIDFSGKDSIAIQVTEFHDWASIAMSKIPMQYDSAGVEYTFETAGMIDIRPVKGQYKFNPKKSIEVQMITLNDDPKFNHYQFNEKEHKWEYKGKEQINPPQQKNSQIALHEDLKEVELQEDIEKCKKRIIQLQEQIPQPPKKVNPQKYNFNIDVDPVDFPEFQDFKNMRFEVKEGQGFDASVYDVSWDDMTLLRINEDVYKITLTKDTKVESYIVQPALSGKDYSQAYNKYIQVKQKVEQDLKEEQEKKTAYETAIKSMKNEHLQQKNKKTTNNVEEQPAWMSAKSPYFKSIDFSKYVNKKQDRTLTASRVFSVGSFGLYNSDHPLSALRRLGTTNIDVTFVDSTGQPLKVGLYYLSEQQENIAFSYNQNSKFRFNPRKENIVWGDLNGGGIVISQVKNWKKVKETKKIPVIVHKDCKTPSQLRDLLSQNQK